MDQEVIQPVSIQTFTDILPKQRKKIIINIMSRNNSYQVSANNSQQFSYIQEQGNSGSNNSSWGAQQGLPSMNDGQTGGWSASQNAGWSASQNAGWSTSQNGVGWAAQQQNGRGQAAGWAAGQTVTDTSAKTLDWDSLVDDVLREEIGAWALSAQSAK
jgi:hypothetical protein